jgi:hypothetical protein
LRAFRGPAARPRIPSIGCDISRTRRRARGYVGAGFVVLAPLFAEWATPKINVRNRIAQDAELAVA